MKKKLTKKQKKFCEHYAVHGMATAAARYAGYKDTETLPTTAGENLRKPYLAAYIAELEEQNKAESHISAAEVVKKLKEVLDLGMEGQPVLSKDGDHVGNKRDLAAVNKALDQLSRIAGLYEKDNNQSRTQVNLQMNF